MKKDLTDITLVLDRSGSMASVQDDTVGGLRSFVEQQAKEDGEAKFTLVQFDTKYEVVRAGVKLTKDVLEGWEFLPRGSTALLDAVGRAINETGKRLKEMDEKDRPEKVIFVILTDGQENSSKEFKKEQIKQMIEHQSQTYKWNFVFLGANQDSFAEAGALGILRGNVMNYAHSGKGTKKAFATVSDNMASYRRSREVTTQNFFDEEDRQQQQELIDKDNMPSPEV